MPYYYPPIFQQYTQNSYSPNQIQQGGFVSVRSMDEVNAWPIAPGNSITFYVETNPPEIATKTKGFSPLENPVIRVFDLRERKPQEQTTQEIPQDNKESSYALKTDLAAVWDALNQLKAEMKAEAKDE